MVVALRSDEILRVLIRHEVDFIVVGGIAAILQGSPVSTEDLDVVYLDVPENHERLAQALDELNAIYADPAGRHIEPTVSRLATLKLHLLKTSFGRLDVLRTVGDGLAYQDLLGNSREMEVDEFRVQVLNLETIIKTKEHADRPKDRYQLLFLRQLLDELHLKESET